MIIVVGIMFSIICTTSIILTIIIIIIVMFLRLLLIIICYFDEYPSKGGVAHSGAARRLSPTRACSTWKAFIV